ncbi:MAG TPA: glutamate-1-semialdehyde 2,1-aminomutase [Actinomycetota bacterium]
MSRSEELFKRAREVIPGGVNSPVRAFLAVGGDPRFVARARGSRLTDVDGREYVDLVMSWGAIILGHADERVTEAIARAAERGSSYGAPHEGEVLLAERLAEHVPSIERVRMVNSGTEATMSAIRLARGATGRSKILKFAGCYHGHADELLARAGSGVETLGLPDTAGVTEGAARDTLVAPFNDAGAVGDAFAAHGDDLACVIVEPVAVNMGVVPPAPGFLEALRARCDQHGALLIFDEVVTGSRLGLGGAQAWYGVTPDLTCLGKVIGGGSPVGAFGGRAAIMDEIAPTGPVYQAGTLSGNPIAVAAGLAVLDALAEDPPYEGMLRRAETIVDALTAAAALAGVPLRVNREGSLFSAFFVDDDVTDLESARRQAAGAYARFFHAMLASGIWLPPSAFEGWFLCAAHTDEDVSRIEEAAERAMRAAAAALRGED